MSSRTISFCNLLVGKVLVRTAPLMAAVVCLASVLPTFGYDDRYTPQSPLGHVRLVSYAKEAALRSLLPKVDDPAIQQVLDDPRLILYTDAEMPPAYQDWDGALQGVHAVDYNISANGTEPFGNGNREFPWGTPAGTHRCANVTSFRFLWLPLNGEGRVQPIVWYRRLLAGDAQKSYAWLFPVGTVVGEVLSLEQADGSQHTFELRVRIREEGDWHVDVFRPFPAAEDLAEAIKQRRSDWQQHAQLRTLISHLEKPLQMRRHTLSDQQPLGAPFREAAGVDVLPPLDDNLAADLLDNTEFRSMLGRAWRKGSGGNWAFAATTNDSFHVVPANYDAGFIEVNRESCARCHETVGDHVREFNPGRDWYGRIRGSDGIFSFHPFDPATISWNGYSGNVGLRPELVSAGLLQRYNPSKHPHDVYQTAPRVEQPHY